MFSKVEILSGKMSMDMRNVPSEDEAPTKHTWSDVTKQGKLGLKKIQSAIATQSSEEDFRKEVMEALAPVFNEVLIMVKTSVNGYDEFLDQFPSLRELKKPIWANMFTTKSYNAANDTNSDIKKQLNDMEVKLKNLQAYMPTTDAFIKV